MSRNSSPRGAERARTCMRLDKKLLLRLQATASKERRSVSNLVELILDEALMKRARAEARKQEATNDAVD